MLWLGLFCGLTYFGIGFLVAKLVARLGVSET